MYQKYYNQFAINEESLVQDTSQTAGLSENFVDETIEERLAMIEEPDNNRTKTGIKNNKVNGNINSIP